MDLPFPRLSFDATAPVTAQTPRMAAAINRQRAEAAALTRAREQSRDRDVTRGENTRRSVAHD